MQAARCPTDELSLTNCAVVSEKDLQSGQWVIIISQFITVFIFERGPLVLPSVHPSTSLNTCHPSKRSQSTIWCEAAQLALCVHHSVRSEELTITQDGFPPCRLKCHSHTHYRTLPLAAISLLAILVSISIRFSASSWFNQFIILCTRGACQPAIFGWASDYN